MNIFINENEHRLRAGWRLLIQFILMFLFVGLATYGMQFIWEDSSRLIGTIPNFLGVTLSIWIAARLLDRRHFSAYGLQLDKIWWREFGFGSLAGLIAIGVIFLLEWMLGWIVLTGFGWERSSSTPFIWLLAGYLIAMLLVGFYEELLSRGYQILNLIEGLRFQKLGTRGATVAAILITSSIFGLMHAGNPNASVISIVNITLAGIVLAIPFLITGRLALSVGLHFSWNFAQGGLFGFPVSGMNFRTSLLQIEQHGTELWTGGAFGPEAGIVGIIGMVIMITLTIYYTHKTGYDIGIHSSFRKEFRPGHNSDEQAL